jgi:hypothetical protein
MSDTPKDAKGIFLAALEIGDVAQRAAFVRCKQFTEGLPIQLHSRPAKTLNRTQLLK